jgi:hypothetical protein
MVRPLRCALSNNVLRNLAEECCRGLEAKKLGLSSENERRFAPCCCLGNLFAFSKSEIMISIEHYIEPREWIRDKMKWLRRRTPPDLEFCRLRF